MGPESKQPEVACQSNLGSQITTGGGFSTAFPQPSYQSVAVKGYLTTAPNLPPISNFNATGRAYPDLSSLGNNFEIIVGGSYYGVSGTSAATPVICAMITLINGDREVNGKKPLGFLNPILYSLNPAVYNVPSPLILSLYHFISSG